MKRLLKIAYAFILVLVLVPIRADTTSVHGLFRTTLSNGLEVYIVESHTVPLVRIQVTFRCGAYAQEPETAGLFHLHEHMLLKANAVHTNGVAAKAAMNELGVTKWNGTTSAESVTYFFTVPSDLYEKGIAFWAAALRHPLFLEKELENEKLVVLNEIRGNHRDSVRVFNAAADARLFFQYPWRLDVPGYEANVTGASADSLRELDQKYYVPNNAAVFIGGDVDPGQALSIVKNYFGDWEKEPDPWRTKPARHPDLEQCRFFVYAAESVHQSVASLEIRFRGPSVIDDPDATYAADVLLMLLANPSGKFMNAVFDKLPYLYQNDSIRVTYPTRRDGGIVTLKISLTISADDDLASRLRWTKQVVLDELTKMCDDPHYFTDNEIDLVKSRIEDQLLLDRQSSERLLTNLSFWWAAAGMDYFLGYLDKMKQVSTYSIMLFVKKYLLTASSVTGVKVNPATLAVHKEALEKDGFEQVTGENAFWWQQGGGHR